MSLFAGQGRHELRAAYREAWRKARARLPLQPVEAQIADVIGLHPEYHALFESEDALSEDYPLEGARTNPFLHLGLHLALREQISTDRPHGIAAIHRRVSATLGSEHAAEHRMIEALAATLWEAQRRGSPPDESLYLERLARL